MKLLIEKVFPGSSYQGKIYDYGIKAKTKSGMILRISDWKRLDLSQFEGKIVNCLILAFMAKPADKTERKEFYDPFHPIFEGIYIGSYHISEIWLKSYKNLKLDLYHAITTKDGIFLTSPRDMEDAGIKKDEKFTFTVGRLDLKSYIPPD